MIRLQSQIQNRNSVRKRLWNTLKGVIKSIGKNTLMAMTKRNRNTHHKMNLIEDIKSIFQVVSERPKEVIIDDVYKILLLNLANNQIDQPFANGNGKHAEFALTQIFEKAKDEVYIFADSLHSETGERSYAYLNSIKQFLVKKPMSRLSIVLENDVDISESLNFIKALKSRFQDRISISKLPLNYNSFSLTTDNQKFHFTIADGRMVRFEYDIQKRKATLNFNDPDFYASLKQCFDKYQYDSVPIAEDYDQYVLKSMDNLRKEFSI